MSQPLKAPFPYFGGKSSVAPHVWERLGPVKNYVEPFFGSGAMLLARPKWKPGNGWIETVNDKDGFVSNFWRALQADPERVANFADWPINENDFHARHIWLVGEKDSLAARLEGDPDFFDAKVAGWWVWGVSLKIGAGWCSGDGSWQAEGGKLIKTTRRGGIPRAIPSMNGTGIHGVYGNKHDFGVLADRMRRVRVASGDWSRVTTYSVTDYKGLTGIFLDPPYSAMDRADVYSHESYTVAHDVRRWCLTNGGNPQMRICLAGYDEHYELLDHGWTATAWKANGGYGNQGKKNQTRQR